MPSFFEIGQLVLEKKIFEGFLPYMGMAAILVMYLHICYPFLLMLHIKFGLGLAKWFQRRRRLNIMVIYMYIAPGGGT